MNENNLESSRRRNLIKAAFVVPFLKTGNIFPNKSENIEIQPGINEDASVEEIEKYLKAHLEPVDYESILNDHDLIYLEDFHQNVLIKKEIKKQLKFFKEKGVTHLLTEFIAKGDQGVIDDYYFDKIPDGSFKDFILSDWGYGKDSGNALFEVFKEAKVQGIKLIGLDLPGEYLKSLELRETLDERNKSWAQSIYDFCHKLGANKIVVFGGGAHFGYNTLRDNVNQLTEEQWKLSGITLSYVSGIKSDIPEVLHFSFENRVAQAAKNLGYESKDFWVKLNLNEYGTKSYDYLIHIGV